MKIPPSTIPLILLLLGPHKAVTAATVDRSVDSQLVHPALEPGAAVVVQDPRPSPGQRWALGMALQYEHQPLRAYLDGEPAGAVIEGRETLHLGASAMVSRRTTLALRGSVLTQQPGGFDQLEPEAATALGDVALMARACFWSSGRAALGGGLTLWLPLGTDDSWASERAFRGEPSLLASVGGERLRVLVNAGMLARPEVDSGADFLASPELTAGVAAVVSPLPWLGLLAEVDSRHGLSSFFEGGAENPALLHGGLRLARSGLGRVDLVGGTGLTQGYGVADWRMMLSLVATPGAPTGPDPEPTPPAVVQPEPPPEPVMTEVQAPAPAPTAWVNAGRIRMKAPVAFEEGTATLAEGSDAILASVAQVINDYPQIELLVVEGTALDAPELDGAYALSLSRSRVVYEALIRASVRPERLGFRGLGTHRPWGDEQDEQVGFSIAALGPAEQAARPGETHPILAPWSGEEIAAPVLGSSVLGRDGNPVLVEDFGETRQPEDFDFLEGEAPVDQAAEEEAP